MPPRGGARGCRGPLPAPHTGTAFQGRGETGLQASQWERGRGALPHQAARPLAAASRGAGAGLSSRGPAVGCWSLRGGTWGGTWGAEERRGEEMRRSAWVRNLQYLPGCECVFIISGLPFTRGRPSPGHPKANFREKAGRGRRGSSLLN